MYTFPYQEESEYQRTFVSETYPHGIIRHLLFFLSGACLLHFEVLTPTPFLLSSGWHVSLNGLTVLGSHVFGAPVHMKFVSPVHLSYINLNIRLAKEPRREEGKSFLPLHHQFILRPDLGVYNGLVFSQKRWQGPSHLQGLWTSSPFG